MRMLVLVAATVSTIAFTQFASAASTAPVYNWTGFYVGGNVGAVVGHASGTSNFVDTSPTSPGSFPESQSFSQSAFLGGAQIGYNWQVSPLWVVGIEGDWDWTDPSYSFCRKTSTSSVACQDNGFGFETIDGKTEWLATARGRLGVTWANWLFYGTGGAAWGKVETDLTLDCRVNGCGESSANTLLASSTTSTTKSGWVAGLGAEVMLAENWTVRAEWLHIDLGTISASLPTRGTTGGTETASWSRTERYDEFRFVLNYLFGPPGL
jgi:outer membrane immunogenic protein